MVLTQLGRERKREREIDIEETTSISCYEYESVHHQQTIQRKSNTEETREEFFSQSQFSIG